MHVCLRGLSAFLFTPTSLEFPTASHMGCLKTFWRWENQTLLSQFLPRSFLLRYGNTEALRLDCFTYVLGFSCREVGLSPPPQGSFLCVWKKYKTEVKDTSGFQTCSSHFTSPTALLVTETVLQFFLCLHSSTIYLKSRAPS